MFLLKNNSLTQSTVISNASSDDWPFKELLLMKKRSQDEQFLFEFVSMCASKIQSYFRMFVTNRRHKIAINKLKRFQGLGAALIRGWKVRKVMECNRIKDSIKIIKEKRNELNELSKNSSDANFNLKKQLYIKSVLRDEINQFKVKFNNFVKNGQWVFEPRDVKQKLKKKKLSQQMIKTENINNKKDEGEQANIIPKKQNRQMRNHAKKIKQEMRQLKKQNMQTENTSTPSTFTSKQIDQNFIERPIKAKGAYIFNEQETNIPEVIEKKNQPKSELEDEKKEVKKNEIKKLQKRTKYDPRKAILEQKKKKREEEIKKECNVSSIQKYTQKKQSQIDIHKEQVFVQDGEKTNNRSTISIGGKVAKVKVESKVNCWGNRKTVIKKQGPQKQRSYTNIHLMRQGESKEKKYQKQQKYLKPEITMEKLASKIFEKKKMQAEIQKQEQQTLKMKQKVRENLEEVNRISLTLNEGRNIKQYSEFMQIQRNRYQQLTQQNIRGAIRKSPETKPKQQVFRSIDELQDTYSKQYSVRLQNLMPKLGFLSTARKAEQSGSIPVIASDSFYVSEVLNLPSQHFLHQTNIMQKNFNLMLRH